LAVRSTAKRPGRRFALLLAVLVLAGGAGIGAIALYDRGYIQLNDPSLADYPVRGVDVSSFQGHIDWQRLVDRSGIRFAFIKASEGTHTRDKRFEQNWEAAKGLVARGAYHFFTFCGSGDAQAQNFLRALPDVGEMPSGVDVEFAGNCTTWTSIVTIRDQLQIFLNEVETATHRVPILYVTRSSYDRIVAGHFRGYPLWVREVVTGPPVRDIPAMIFWQYTGTGRKEGIAKLVDLNAFIGSSSRFETFLRRAAG
jgi:lysozyme